jgi:hypothetical protein
MKTKTKREKAASALLIAGLILMLLACGADKLTVIITLGAAGCATGYAGLALMRWL